MVGEKPETIAASVVEAFREPLREAILYRNLSTGSAWVSLLGIPLFIGMVAYFDPSSVPTIYWLFLVIPAALVIMTWNRSYVKQKEQQMATLFRGIDGPLDLQELAAKL
jgi:hypothetical protein